MKEYIEREALLEEVEGLGNLLYKGAIYDFVEDFPTADVVERSAFNKLMERYEKATGRKPSGAVRQLVEVVRCKDCKYGELNCNSVGAEYVVCELDEHHVWLPNNFCSYGERRDDNESL